MRIKRLLALLLACAAIAGMLVLPSSAGAAATTTFTDIYDTNVAQAAETLRLLGIVSGTGGTAFSPDRALTRNSARWRWSSWATATRWPPR